MKGATSRGGRARGIMDAVRPAIPTLLRWLCIAVFALGGGLGQSGLVICRDSQGSAQLEWGCDRGKRGDCHGPVTSGRQSQQGRTSNPVPCDDTPLELGLAQSGQRELEAPALPAPLAAALPEAPRTSRAGPVCASKPVPKTRPPDGPSRLRSIILIV